MALIPNFPQNLLDDHHRWHAPSAHPGPGGRVRPFGTTGSGIEFLQFHRDYIARFRAWYDAQPFGTAPFNVAPFQNAASAQAAIAEWTSVPAAIKNPIVTGWGGVQIGQEARLSTLTPPFSSEDELGTYIEGGIHGWIHGATAAAFGEPEVATLHSPRSTHFYGIHGLVNYWWRQWQNSRRPIKDFLERKPRLRDKLAKELVKERVFEKMNVEKPIKEKDKDKDLVEGGGFPERGGDPFMLASTGNPMLSPEANMAEMAATDPLLDIHQRLSDLETMVSQQAFIQTSERPPVGEAATKQHDESRGTRAAKKNDDK